MKDNDLAKQWRQATKGLSGKDALRAWRQHWDARQGRDGSVLLSGAGGAPKQTYSSLHVDIELV